MKTPSKKTQTKSKSKAKNNKKHQVVVYILRSIPKPIRFVLITIVIFLIYGAIHNWSTQQIAANYLRNKYNKEFNLRWDNSAPNWIGKPPTYHGLAKVKDGSDDVEFVVMCRIEGRECSDFYLRESWSRSEERSIKEYLKNDLPKGIKIDVDMISKVDEYDKKASIDDFDYYLKKHKERLLNHYLIKFEDYENDSDIETGKVLLKRLLNT